jgi:23S rRNA (cytidine1920-2'-O)/16S rRNA (cytidine1409-2'-O)-methyltransferase
LQIEPNVTKKGASETTTRKRADVLLVERGLFESRARARAAIDAGFVIANDRQVLKASEIIAADTVLRAQPAHPWVSRGGVKLDFALQHFAIDAAAATALDIGASTGGFTDVLLARGAARVYAVDVGRGQLAWKLRQDPRVVVHEATNARYLAGAQIPEPIDLITCDASFIGLSTLLPAPLSLAADRAQLVALIKPQFEAGAKAVGKGGVVRDPAIHQEVCERVAAWLGAQPGWRVMGIAPSPIQGPAGNREFLIYARRGE